jgi:hypothetical protein
MHWGDFMSIEKDVEYREALSSMRHFGGIRFQLMTVFYVVTGALYYAVVQPGTTEASAERTMICSFGLLLALVFLTFEVIINRYITNAGKHASSIYELSHLHARPAAPMRFLVPTLICLVYILVALFWIGKGDLSLSAVAKSAADFLLR